MEKILVSACLIGEKVRYDGKSKLLSHPLWQKWQKEGRLVAVCPEVAGGLSVPRPAAEIKTLSGKTKVLTQDGVDLSSHFAAGAAHALAIARANNVRIAILTDGSPSCGSSEVHDGNFSGEMLEGEGVTTALLRKNGIKVFSHKQLDLVGE